MAPSRCETGGHAGDGLGVDPPSLEERGHIGVAGRLLERRPGRACSCPTEQLPWSAGTVVKLRSAALIQKTHPAGHPALAAVGGGIRHRFVEGGDGGGCGVG